MRAIVLALVGREERRHEKETRHPPEERKAEDAKDTTTTVTNISRIKEGKGKSDADLLLVFKPVLRYAIESVQKCALVHECIVCVEKEDATFAKELLEKMTTTTNPSAASSSSSSNNKSATLTTTTTTEKKKKKKKVRFEVLEVEGKKRRRERVERGVDKKGEERIGRGGGGRFGRFAQDGV